MGKVIEQSKIEELVNQIKKQGKTIVATNGCFDILHVGHVRYLKKSKSFGDVLIVGLNSDVSVKSIKGPTRPVNNENDRAEVLCALSSVDYVVLFDEDSPRNLLDAIKPNIYTKGADYTLKTLPEADVILKNKGWVEFIDFVEGKSTTKIIDKMK
ncbi:MAG: D-glycero-beta-D-manno-heptose 1-phosphate adenylyltransferase [Candidatus Gastranaerophilales bacterium]|nr:D-glycero-beta-D-manno-heptose 1-phosphate adenylyltransferase [Candidatus Gastranaerophilales bacterium]